MNIDGKTRIAGLVGNPVEHTLSPLIQNTFASVMGVNAAYIPLGVKNAEELETALQGARAFGFAGMNVTVPYKRAVMEYLDHIDAAAENIGAVNTIRITDKGLEGFNTDVTGFVRQMELNGISVAGADAVVIGAGGASMAVCEGLRQLYVDHIYMLNRSTDKAREAFGEYSDITILGLDEFNRIPENKYVCIQCTSVGLPDSASHAAIEDESFYELVETGVELIYNPQETMFMKKVISHGGKAFNGLNMLIYQAAGAFELYHGIPVSEDAVNRTRAILKDRF